MQGQSYNFCTAPKRTKKAVDLGICSPRVVLCKAFCIIFQPVFADGFHFGTRHIGHAAAEITVHPSEVEGVGERGSPIAFGDVVPKTHTSEFRVAVDELTKPTHAPVFQMLPQAVVALEMPTRLDVGQQTLFIPIGQINQGRILDPLGEAPPIEHLFDQHTCHPAAQLLMEFFALLVVVDHHLIAPEAG